MIEEHFDPETRMDHPTVHGSQFRELTDASPDGVVVVDHSGRILFANPAAALLFDIPVEELEGPVFDGYVETGSAGSGRPLTAKSQQLTAAHRKLPLDLHADVDEQNTATD